MFRLFSVPITGSHVSRAFKPALPARAPASPLPVCTPHGHPERRGGGAWHADNPFDMFLRMPTGCHPRIHIAWSRRCGSEPAEEGDGGVLPSSKCGYSVASSSRKERTPCSKSAPSLCSSSSSTIEPSAPPPFSTGEGVSLVGVAGKRGGEADGPEDGWGLKGASWAPPPDPTQRA